MHFNVILPSALTYCMWSRSVRLFHQNLVSWSGISCTISCTVIYAENGSSASILINISTDNSDSIAVGWRSHNAIRRSRTVSSSLQPDCAVATSAVCGQQLLMVSGDTWSHQGFIKRTSSFKDSSVELLMLTFCTVSKFVCLPTDVQLNCLKNNFKIYIKIDINPLNPELNPIC